MMKPKKRGRAVGKVSQAHKGGSDAKARVLRNRVTESGICGASSSNWEVLQSGERWAYGAVLTASSALHMADGASQWNRDRCDPESGISSENTRVHRTSSRRSSWTNGQCVVAVPTPSILTPSFDLELCRTQLEKEGFHIPVEDFETPLRTALEPPSIRRYLFFNSSLFHFIMAPIVYVVLWCAVYSSLHRYLKESIINLWVLCLCVSLIVVIITAAIILVFHYNKKEAGKRFASNSCSNFKKESKFTPS
ncbi:hypothetical protein PDJAM_G00177780 [Pangasius djambal]|uniref:Uncharacterized protein n=1 Tax=Pangasius djambal TaxID=1691987 RepID=A0ACC5ZP59_9TELE|nr:hypothetical protein [Pangasius djambal]